MILEKFHGDSMLDYPTLLRDNLLYRENLLRLCYNDENLRGDICALFVKDPVWAINTWFWTFDPRNGQGDRIHLPKDLPFIFYDYQHEAFSELIDAILCHPHDLLIDKSRDMGATWLVLAAFLWCWLCIPSFQALVGSRKEQLVDNWMIDSHFGKLRYMLARLPDFLKPMQFHAKVHDTKLNLYNPANGASIQGEATGPDFSRQGRYNVALLDEYASWENDKEAWTATADSTTCRIALSTPQGLVNQFGNLRYSSTTKILSLHWTRHPYKSDGMWQDEKKKKFRSPWYDSECKRRNYDEVEIAQELDIDYGAAGRPVFDINTIRNKVLELRQNPPVIIYGDLFWKEGYEPKYSEKGFCINRDNLQVDFTPSDVGCVGIYRYPDITAFKNRYFLSADTAEGLEQGDWDVTSVTDRANPLHLVTVAELRGHWSPHLYAGEIAKLGVFYGYCPAWVEKNNHGHAVLEKLFEIYPNLGHEKYQDHGALTEFSEKLGWLTTQVSKPIIIDALDEIIRGNLLNDPFVGFWEECLTFVKDAYGRMSAQNKAKGGKFFDDRVMNRAIATQAHKYLPSLSEIKVKTEDEQAEAEYRRELDNFTDMIQRQTGEPVDAAY